MNEGLAKKILHFADEMLENSGFTYTFVCGAHFDSERTMSFPFIINFDENLLTEFLHYFLNMEENKGVKEKLFKMFNPVAEELDEFIKTVKL